MAADSLHPEPGGVQSEEDTQVEEDDLSAELCDVCSNMEDLGVDMTDSGTMLFHYSEATVSKLSLQPWMLRVASRVLAGSHDQTLPWGF